MSNQAVGNVYQSIIEEVINSSRVDFEESGVEESVLEELRQVSSAIPLPQLHVAPIVTTTIRRLQHRPHKCAAVSAWPSTFATCWQNCHDSNTRIARFAASQMQRVFCVAAKLRRCGGDHGRGRAKMGESDGLVWGAPSFIWAFKPRRPLASASQCCLHRLAARQQGTPALGGRPAALHSPCHVPRQTPVCGPMLRLTHG